MTNHTDGLDAAGVAAAVAAYNFSSADMAGSIKCAIAAYLEATRRSALVDAPAGETVPQLGGAPDDLHNLIKVTFADMTIERMNEVCKQVLAMRKPVASPTPSIAALQAEIERLRVLLDSIIARDDRNGSLPKWYRHEIDANYRSGLE